MNDNDSSASNPALLRLLASGVDHKSLRDWLAAGVPLRLSVSFQPGGWVITVHYGSASNILSAQRAKPRQFKRFETIVAYLLELGITHFEVDATGYDPEAVSTYTRPDVKAPSRGSPAA